MNRKQLIEQISDQSFRFYYGRGYLYELGGSDKENIVYWVKSLLSKLDNVKLAQEARKCGIKISSSEIS